ncbi:SIT4 phosphatase-associated protein-domain-containing protein [Lineolata rhizophorae]|uniref:SIT4 phosphatase-associated protein-domain-containing protein n=1 Tax=Lineolata rhizophorae TaxID=578093 RepID=A0A6A6NLB3_9PEZI|nr:SIT4 phosphatase-associated protein-domain-containing protein [Lineolata rhizophorae]
MFWRFGGYANISTLDSILDKPDVTVEELLDESDLIQELKQQNSKLIEYLRDPKVLERLLQYVVAPPKDPARGNGDGAEPEKEKAGVDDEGDDKGALDSPGAKLEKDEGEKSEKRGIEVLFSKSRGRSKSTSSNKGRATSGGAAADSDESKEDKQRLKYAYVACEILASEVWSISEALLESRDTLREFWKYLKQPPQLDPVQAGYFTKVNEALLDRKTEEMLEFFKSLDGVVEDMLQHVDCPMVMDLLLKIVSLEKAEGGQGIVDWLQSQSLIPILLSYLSPQHPPSVQTSAGDFLKAIITISANATTADQSVIGPNELTRQLVSAPCVRRLISDMLGGGNPLTVGVGIVIEVIRKNNSDYDQENQAGPVPKTSDPIYLGTLLRQFAENVPDFMDLILRGDKVAPITHSDGTISTGRRELKAAFGGKIEPLGFDRFKTCELMAELLHCSNMALLNERGAEADVARRDAERERLKREGKLGVLAQGRGEGGADEDVLSEDVEDSEDEGVGGRRRRASSGSAESREEFSKSVDSQGFTHARFPSATSEEEADEVRKKLAGSAEEEGFERVEGREVFARDEDEGSSEEEDTRGKKGKKDAESPTAAGVTERVGGIELDSDTVMAEDDKQESAGGKSLLSQQLTAKEPKVKKERRQEFEEPSGMSPHPEDKPPPLFAKKGGVVKGERDDRKAEETKKAVGEEEGQEMGTVEATREGPYGVYYEVDIDGTPVVGDMLKIMFVENRVVPTILDFFFRFPWNNFLHNVVYDVVQQVFNGQMDRGFNRGLAIDLFETGAITDRIVEGQRASDRAQDETHMRLGYMGHLTLIAEEVVKFTERQAQAQAAAQHAQATAAAGETSAAASAAAHDASMAAAAATGSSPSHQLLMPQPLAPSVVQKVTSAEWVTYVETTLAETRERDNAILGGVRPDLGVGPRQAVLNAVAGGGGFGGGGGGVSSGNGSIGLDSMELGGGAGAGASGGAYGGGVSGAGLLSGFSHSSDEEDEEMEDGGVEGVGEHVGDADQVGELSFEDVEMEYR